MNSPSARRPIARPHPQRSSMRFPSPARACTGAGLVWRGGSKSRDHPACGRRSPDRRDHHTFSDPRRCRPAPGTSAWSGSRSAPARAMTMATGGSRRCPQRSKSILASKLLRSISPPLRTSGIGVLTPRWPPPLPRRRSGKRRAPSDHLGELTDSKDLARFEGLPWSGCKCRQIREMCGPAGTIVRLLTSAFRGARTISRQPRRHFARRGSAR
jgi:hypothetical protein